MKLELVCAWRNLLKLFRFLLLYAGGVALLFYLLPIVFANLEGQYDALSGTARFAAVTGFFLVIAVWQIIGKRDRLRRQTG